MQLGIREAQAAENTEPAAGPEGTFFLVPSVEDLHDDLVGV